MILFCGADFQRKGLDRAVLALARMRKHAQLIVVGDGDSGPYEALARQHGVRERVRFIGPRTDTGRYFQAADIFVLPTRLDMWGITIPEAMATAIPAVTTTAAGAADVLTDGETGFVLQEPLDLGLLAATLDRLAADPDLRVRIGRAAQRRAATLTTEDFGRQTEAAMQEVAQHRRAQLTRGRPPLR